MSLILLGALSYSQQSFVFFRSSFLRSASLRKFADSLLPSMMTSSIMCVGSGSEASQWKLPANETAEQSAIEEVWPGVAWVVLVVSLFSFSFYHLPN